MIAILNDVLGSRPRAFENRSRYGRASACSCARGLRRRARRSRREHEVVAAFYPLAYAAEQVGGDRSACEPHAGRAPSPTTSSCAASDVARVQRRRRSSSTSATASCRLSRRRSRDRDGAVARPRSRATPDRRRGGARRRSARLARPRSLRAIVARDRGGARARPAAADDLAAQARRSSTRVSPRARALRAPRDRHEPRGFRLPRAALRPRADPAHRASRPRPSRARGARAARREVSSARARRRSSSRRSSRPSSPRRSRARPASTTAVLDPLEGLTDERARRRAPTTSRVMRANLATLRKALGCT